MIKVIFRIALLACLLAGCVQAGEPPATRIPTTTIASQPPTLMSASATELLVPSATLPMLTPTLAESSPTVAASLTGTADLLPTQADATQEVTLYPQPSVGSGAVQILTPGPLSKVISPIKLRAYVLPAFDYKATVELYGEDGRLLMREIIQVEIDGTWSYVYQEIPFEVHAAGELGRLSVSTKDEFGHTTAMYSVHVLLLSEGTEQINPPGNLTENAVIDSPSPSTHISGGKLHVSGLMRPFNSQPLVVDLVAEQGSVIGSRQANVAPTPGDDYVPFSVDLAYNVSQPTKALLVVRQADDRITGGMYLYSQPILLNP